MILYTMMPQELVFPVQEEAYSQQMVVSYQGVPMMVEKMEERSYRIIRIVSTDPQHYLNEYMSPGTKITF
jgi:hypothetical protein